MQTTLISPWSGVWAALTWLYDVLIGVWRELNQPERMLLAANLCFAGVGAYASYLFYLPSRGPIIGGMAAAAIECIYLGAAGVAVKHADQRWLANALIGVGFLASVFFGVMVGLKDVFPALFGGELHTQAIIWPSRDQWMVLGAPAIVEGVVPSLCSLLLSLFLHEHASARLVDAEKQQQQQRDDFMPYVCPFCDEPKKTPAALFGHYGRCAKAQQSTLSEDEKKAIVRKAVEDGKGRV
jgi:hypothetical protein